MAEHEMHVEMPGDQGRTTRVPVDYPSNSKRSRQAPRTAQPEPKKVEKIVTGRVIRKRKGLYERVGHSLFAEDSGGSEGILEGIIMDVLVPAAKSMLYEAGTFGLERALYGAFRPKSRADRPGGYTPYNRVIRTRPQAAEYGQHTISARTRAHHEFDDLILATRGEAEDVLDQMHELIDLYDQATVADLYSLVGIPGPYTDNTWGWYDLSNASVRHVRGGYMLVLPRTQAIEQ